MRIDNNAEALAMMRRALGSFEAKIREAYNKGYRSGVKSMMAEDGPIDRDELGDCNICRYVGLLHRCSRCVNGSHFCKIEDKPQTNDYFREPTDEERKSINDYIDSISVPTGVNVFDLMDELQTEREKE